MAEQAVVKIEDDSLKNGDYDLVTAPKDYPGRLYRNKYCYLHYLVFWQNKGIVPNNDEIIHHIDGNKHNNQIDNLKLMSRVEHSKLHGENKKRVMVLLRCPVCKSLFVREKRQTHLAKKGTATYCSRECAYKAITLRRFNEDELKKDISKNVIMQF